MAFSNVYIAGLGLIGGSFAKDLVARRGTSLHGEDLDAKTQAASGLSAQGLEKADLVLLCLPPTQTVPFIHKNLKAFQKGAVLVNCAGVQAPAARECTFLSERGLTYAGAHPMAGSEKAGYSHAMAGLFAKAGLIFCFEESISEETKQRLEEFFRFFGFSSMHCLTPETHDAIIGLVSQLPHILAASLMNMQTEHSVTFAGPSLKDMTRIAEINAPLWTELFLQNKGGLLSSLQVFETQLQNLSSAIKTEDRTAITAFLEEAHQKRVSFFGKKR